jgi:EmrB/QacA subfamily drug resistance transporter
MATAEAIQVGPAAGTTAVGVTRRRYRLTFAVILLAVLAFSMLQSLVLPALPTIQASLHVSQSSVTWVLTAYLLSASIATPVLGRIGDMIGRKKVFVGVLVVLGAGSLIAALASSIAVLIVARIIQGAGGAVIPLAFGIVRDHCPADRVASAVSKVAALLGVGAGLGIILAGPIVDILDYHYLFWLPMIVVALAAIGAYFFVPESANTISGRISVLPTLLMAGWLVALLLAASEGGGWGWASGRTVGLSLLAVGLILGWVFSELRAAQPLIDMRMMRIPTVWTTNLVGLLTGMAIFSIFTFVPVFVQTSRTAGYGFGASITGSGIFLLPMTVTMFVFGLWSGPLTARIGSKSVLVIGSALNAASLAILTLAHQQQWDVYLASAFAGMGMGFAVAAMSNLTVQSVPASQTSVASGMNANIRTIGGSIGAAVMASLITSHTAASHLPTATGFTEGFLFLLIGTVIATIVSVAIPSAPRPGR